MEKTIEMDTSELRDIFKGLYWELENFPELTSESGKAYIKYYEIDLSEFKVCNGDYLAPI